MQRERSTSGSPLAQVREYLQSLDRDRGASGRSATEDRVRRTADLRAQVVELGEEALALDDEAMAGRALRLRQQIEEMDDAADPRATPS